MMVQLFQQKLNEATEQGALLKKGRPGHDLYYPKKGYVLWLDQKSGGCAIEAGDRLELICDKWTSGTVVIFRPKMPALTPERCTFTECRYFTDVRASAAPGKAARK